MSSSPAASSAPSSPSKSRDAWGVTWDQLDKRRYYGATVTSSICVRALIYPVNVAKTRQQHEGSSKKQSVFEIARREGVGRLYRGFTFNAAMGVVGGPYYLTVLERSRAFFKDTVGLSSSGASTAAALSGTFSSQLLLVPTDNVTQRLMIAQREGDQAGGGTTATQQLKHLYASQGMRGLYRGISTSIMLYAPNGALFWNLYTAFKGLWPAAWDNFMFPQIKTPICGAVAGSISMALTTPLDVVKTRTQLSSGETPWAVAKEVVRAEGYAGFWLGARMRLWNGVVMYSILMTAYDSVKWFAAIDNADQATPEATPADEAAAVTVA